MRVIGGDSERPAKFAIRIKGTFSKVSLGHFPVKVSHIPACRQAFEMTTSG